MRIFFYPPFKPLGHSNPSGDLIIATGIYDYLLKNGHDIIMASSLRSRWLFWKPWLFPEILMERRNSIKMINKIKPDLWLTYHTYYKAPDFLGPYVCHQTGLPYVIFQGIYSTKRKRKLTTLPGYLINRKALCSAKHVITNRKEDQVNLKRLLPENRITYIRPGISPENFYFDERGRIEIRRKWKVGDDPVILSAAMFRPGIKTKGISWVVRACGNLYNKGIPLYLVIAGEGKEERYLKKIAAEHLGDRVRFLGKIPREEMRLFYSAGDIFAFPGFRESLGMVYLEAQSCGIPIIACSNGGIPEVVINGETGILVPIDSFHDFEESIAKLISNSRSRKEMGEKARKHIINKHDISKNYIFFEAVLERVIS
jgi:glycosyltransferase involved in cell wall biosynthesis